MFTANDMHHIQKDIILSLASHSPLRFSELQPSRVPNNTFSYHLKKLLESEYIVLTDKGYVATRKALKTVQYNPGHIKSATVPALITIIYATNDEGKVLLLKRRSRPFAEWYGIPSGLIHQGESLELAARRELFEKTGIASPEPLDFAGVLDFKYLEHESKDLFVHAVAFIYKYKCHGYTKLAPQHESKYGELFWSDMSHKKILPEVYKIADLVNAGGDLVNSVDFEEPITSL